MHYVLDLKFWLECVLLSIIGAFGFLGNIITFIVLKGQVCNLYVISAVTFLHNVPVISTPKTWLRNFPYFQDAHIFQPFCFYELNFYFQKSYIKGCLSTSVFIFLAYFLVPFSGTEFLISLIFMRHMSIQESF